MAQEYHAQLLPCCTGIKLRRDAAHAFLDHACRDNPDLRTRIDRLLAAHPQVGAFLEPVATGPYVEPPAEPSPRTPSDTEHHTPELDVGTILVGKYKLLEEIGTGGMGSVWMAQQTEPVKRHVAVKVIKTGMDSKAVLARFGAEQQALALMDHPNIARVLDAGSTPDGRPFFVMELVKGVPITQFCDQRRLTPRERLELFVPVCQAIQHAHQKGVIHRDVKPRNVLVALYDDRPVPKVIDFGVAKAMGQPLTEQTLNTGFGTVVGTPEYMSPEQATFNNLDVDTRSDVYSLGVLLYELLTGSPPITQEHLKKAGLMEILRVVREEEPSRPSTKLSTADTLASLAASRSTEPKKLMGVLRNELDWVVMKALEKDRTRRYETANGFAADVLRYLSGEPVQAVPPSVGYRMRKFVRKHRGPVVGALAVLVVFVLGMVGTTWGLVRAEQARTATAEQQRIAEAKEADRARAEAKIALQQQAEEQRQLRNRDAASALLAQVVSALQAGDAIRAAEAFEQTQKRIGEGGADDLKEKLERCRIELAMLQELDRIDNARWTVVDGKLPSWEVIAPRWAAAFAGYGIIPGITSLQEAARRIQESLIRERLLTSLEVWFVGSRRELGLHRILAATDPDEFRNEARARNYPQAVLSRAFRGKPMPPAQPVWFAIGHGADRMVDRGPREQLLLSAHQVRPNSFPILMVIGTLDEFHEKESALRGAGWYRAALAVNPASVAAWNNLGNALEGSGDLAGAIAAHKEAIRLDPKVALAHSHLGNALKHSGDLAGAIAAHKQAIRLDPKDAKTHSNLGTALYASGDWPGAIGAFQEAIRLDSKLATVHYNLGNALAASGDLPGAIASYQEAIRLDPKYATAYYNLGNALRASGDLPGAIASYQEAIRLDPKLVQAHHNLGLALRVSGDLPGAIASSKEAIRLDPNLASAHNNLGAALNATGDLPGAIASYKEAIRLDPKDATAHTGLGYALHDLRDLPGAIDSFKVAIRLDPKDAKVHTILGAIYGQQKKYADAIACAREAIRLDPKHADAHALLGHALLQMGDVPGAQSAWTEAARLDPKRWGRLLAMLPPIPLAPPPREVKP